MCKRAAAHAAATPAGQLREMAACLRCNHGACALQHRRRHPRQLRAVHSKGRGRVPLRQFIKVHQAASLWLGSGVRRRPPCRRRCAPPQPCTAAAAAPLPAAAAAGLLRGRACPLHQHSHCEERQVRGAGQDRRFEHLAAAGRGRAAACGSGQSRACTHRRQLPGNRPVASRWPLPVTPPAQLRPSPAAPEVRAQHDAGRGGQAAEAAQRGGQQRQAVGGAGALAEFVDDAEGAAGGGWRATTFNLFSIWS